MSAIEGSIECPDEAAGSLVAFGSGVGAARLADLTMTVNGASCTVRVGVVWTIDSNRYSDCEDVDYDPATLVACSWVR